MNKQITRNTVLKQGDKSYPAIQTEQGIVWIDKDAEIKDMDWYVWNNGNDKYLLDKATNKFHNRKTCTKIIAANFELEGVPKIELEDEVEKLARVEYEKILHKHITYSDFVLAFSIGYKTNQAK